MYDIDEYAEWDAAVLETFTALCDEVRAADKETCLRLMAKERAGQCREKFLRVMRNRLALLERREKREAWKAEREALLEK